MLKLFYKRLKDQTGLAFIPVLIVASLVITGLGLWSVGTEAKKTIDKKEPLYKYGQENNTEDAEAYQEQINKAMVKAAVEGGKVAVGTVAGVHDTYLVNTALDAAGAFDTEKRKTTKLDKLDPPLASEDEFNRLMQLTEDEIDRLLEETDAEDLPGLSDEEIDRLLGETKNLDYGIEKMVKKKVELNSDPETTPQEKKTIVDETIKNIQKAEDNNNKVDLNSWLQTILKGSEKLADQKLIDLRKALARNQLSSDYNTGIIEKYEEYQAKGQGISDTSELAEAKRRLAGLYDESKVIEAKIKELEDAKKVASESEEAKGLTDENKQETDTQPTDAKQETDTQPTEAKQETDTQPTEATPDTVLPAELNLKGTLTNSVGMVHQLTLNINFETQIVTGTISYSGPAEWIVWDIDENGNIIPETKRSAVFQSTANGTINGTIDINSKIIRGDLSCNYSTYWEEKNKTLTSTLTSTILGSLVENNNASGTATGSSNWDPSSWSASPY